VVPCKVLDGFGEPATAQPIPEPAVVSPAVVEPTPEPAAVSPVVAKPVPEPVQKPVSSQKQPAPAPVEKPAPAATPVAPDAAQKPSQGGGFISPGRQNPVLGTSMLPSELASSQSGDVGSRGTGFPFLDAAYIQAQPQAVLGEFLGRSAAEIMDKEVVWAGPEDTVQDVIAKMQQHNVGYVLVGTNGVLEGLLSGSDVMAAVSLYLRPMFAKWRRPQDDATLGVKVKWIMSRPVRTIRPDATLASMIETMRRCGGRCLPVVDAKGVVQGVVTVFDILLRILESDKSISWKGRPPQAPPLLI